MKLGCGCAFRVSADEARRDQLFIGKAMTCAECGEERGGERKNEDRHRRARAHRAPGA